MHSFNRFLRHFLTESIQFVFDSQIIVHHRKGFSQKNHSVQNTIFHGYNSCVKIDVIMIMRNAIDFLDTL